MQWATTMAVVALFAVSACSSGHGPTDAERTADREYEQFVDEQRHQDWLAQQEQEDREDDEEQRAEEAERKRAGREAGVESYREKYQEIEYYAELDGYIDESEQRALDGTMSDLRIFEKYGEPVFGGLCPRGLPIKGNHSVSGDWIYHLPNWTYYFETLPEECFRTEREARDAGYRASRVR